MAGTTCETSPMSVDETEGLHARGERARAVPWSERRVRGSAEEDHLEVREGQRDVRHEVAIERMEHHRSVDFAEDARFDQPDLASAPLFGRRPDKLDRAA